MWQKNIDQFFIINLNRRPERMKAVNLEMEKHSLPYMRWAASENPDGRLGLITSVINTLQYALKKDYKTIAIVEDDCKFLVDDLEGVMSNAIAQLPADFDLLYGGTNLFQPTVFREQQFHYSEIPKIEFSKYSENLIQLTDSYATHFIIYSVSGMRKVLKALTEMQEVTPLDILIKGKIMFHGGCFCTFPMIATQAISKSDIATQMNEKGEIVPLEGEQNQAPFLEHRFNQRVSLSTVGVKLMGGLGNQLFMTATCMAYAWRNGKSYCIHRKVENPHYEGQLPYNFPGVNYCSNAGAADLLLIGYFQSEKYFAEYRQRILEALSIPYQKKEGFVAVHVRRGDYLNLQTIHPPVTLEYIHKAIQYFKDKFYERFIIFSDDIDWCIDNIDQDGDYEYSFSEGRTELEDLALLSSCEHQICSNSSFSWFGAWLNQNPDKQIIMPAIWFGESMPHNTKDLYLPNAIIL